MAPDHIVDYLIVHELSHIIEPNHSKNFGTRWETTAKISKKRKWLRENGHNLFCSPYFVRNIESTQSEVL